jgi:hypothetical protein
MRYEINCYFKNESNTMVQKFVHFGMTRSLNNNNTRIKIIIITGEYCQPFMIFLFRNFDNNAEILTMKAAAAGEAKEE